MQIPVRIVLVETSHPGNIGASARAMKAMGLGDLVLVRPRYFPSAEATARAAGADDVLAGARVVDGLAAAVADCGFVVGASARPRSASVPAVDPRACAGMIWRELPANRVAIVLGPEQSGLTNDDLARCQRIVRIPTEPAFGSLNLAMAVQILCYELRISQAQAVDDAPRLPLATAAELEHFHRHLEELLVAAGFLRADHQTQLKLKLRRIFQRARLDQNEIDILRGVLSALDSRKRAARRAGGGI